MQLNPFAALRGRSEQRSQDAVDALAQAFFYGGNVSASGVRVTPETALASVAVAACIEVRAETFSALPGGVYKRDGRMRQLITDHDVYRLVFDHPNDLMNSGQFLRWKQMRQDITGNAYARIVWKGGRPVELWPLYGTSNPEVRVKDGKVAYRYLGDDITPKGDYPATDILHFRGTFLKNPLEAASPIDLIRDTIGLSIATEQFFGRFLNNGTHFPTYLETDNALTPDDVKAIANSLKTTAGVLGAGTTRVFDRGLKVKQNTMSLRDADLSAQMRWYLEQICRIYRVPLPLVQDWTHGTYTNSEQAGLWFAQHTITPIAVDTERTVRKLFLPGEEDHYVKFNVDAILRGDYATRTAGYQTLIMSGVMSRNEARALEDLDPYDGGDEYLVPLNMVTSSQLQAESDDNLLDAAKLKGANKAEPVEAEAEPAAEPAATEPRTMLQPVIDDIIDRIRIRAAQDAERGRPVEHTRTWAIENVLPPVQRALELAGVDIDVTTLVDEALTVTPIGD